MKDIARNVVVVRREGDSGKTTTNPNQVTGWCVVHGQECAWVLKTLGQWKFVEKAEVGDVMARPRVWSSY